MAARTIVDVLADVIAALAGPYELPSTLEVLCRDACTVLGASSAAVELADPERASVTAEIGGPSRGAETSHAIPIRVDDASVGSLVLHRAAADPFDRDEREVACILAEAIGALVVVARQREQHRERVAQLQHALDSRVVIEQAKGVLAARLGLPLQDAFEVLRARARDHNLRLADVAQRVVTSQDDEDPRPVRRDG